MTLVPWVRADLAAALGVIADAVGGPGAVALRASGLVDDPDALADTLITAMAGSGGAALSALAEDGPPLAPVAPLTANRRAQGRAQDALVAFVREAAGIEVARRAASMQGLDRASAQALLERALALLDAIGLDAEPELWVALQDLRTALIEHYEAHIPHLPHLRVTEQLAGLPSLVGAYRLTGGLDIETDLVAHNAVPRPGFLPAGALEVVDV